MAESLEQLLRTLPQELYDQIFDLTFAKIRTNNVEVTVAYKPPALLQVSQRTPGIFAAAYYKDTEFIFSDAGDPAHDRMVVKWLRFLPKSHFDTTQDVVLHAARAPGVDVLDQRGGILRHTYAELIYAGLDLKICRFLRAEVEGQCDWPRADKDVERHGKEILKTASPILPKLDITYSQSTSSLQLPQHNYGGEIPSTAERRLFLGRWPTTYRSWFKVSYKSSSIVVLHLTFMPSPAESEVLNTSSYRIPALLHSNDSTRKLFATRYYQAGHFRAYAAPTLRSWFASSPESHVDLLACMTLEQYRFQLESDNDDARL